MEHVAGIDDLLDEAALLRGAVDGRKKLDQSFPIPVAGILFQRLPQGLVLDTPALREPRRVGGEERERKVRIALVLRQVEANSPDLLPGPRPLLEPPGEAPARGVDVLADPAIQLRPKG